MAAPGDLNGDSFQDFLGSSGTRTRRATCRSKRAPRSSIWEAEARPSELARHHLYRRRRDRAGVSVAGNFDFNGDGRRDIVIGAEQVDRTTGVPVTTGSGKVYVIFFDPNDSFHYPNLTSPDLADTVSLALVGQPGGIPGVVFEGVASGDQAGFSVASGQNGILIGAPGADPDGRTDAGAAYVVSDSSSLSGTISLSRISSGLPDQIPGRAYFGTEPGDNLGFSVAFGGDLVLGQTAGSGTVVMGAPGSGGRRGVGVVAPPGDPDTTPIIVEAIGTTRSGFRILGTQTANSSAGRSPTAATCWRTVFPIS